MKPTIQFHGVTAIRVEPVMHVDSPDTGPFTSREIVIVGSILGPEGEQRISLFSRAPGGLEIHEREN